MFSAVWFARLRDPGALRRAGDAARPGPARGSASSHSYRLLIGDVRRACSAPTATSVWFLVACALYRDGLAAVFAFGAILAVSVYGMAQDTC